VSTWLPIETAPKDGTKILVFTVHGDIELSSWFQTRNDDYELVEGDLYRKVDKLFYAGWNSNMPTHWMPLPDPPTVPKKESKP